MGNRLRIGLLTALLAAPAQAQVAPPPAEPAEPAPSSIGFGDGLGMAGTTVLSSLLLLLAGATLGAASCPRTLGDGDSCGSPLAGGLLGALIGSAIGPAIYHGASEGRGSLGWAYGGLGLGLLTGIVVGDAGGGGLAFALPFVGAGIGYVAGAPTTAQEQPHFTPTLNVQSEPGGGRRYTAGVGFSF